MAHTTPATNLMWAVMTVMFGGFLVFHLWSFDRFKCLKWNHSPNSGAFKRVMTYSYLLSMPLIIAYAVGFTTIKYYYGFMVMPGVGLIPTPYEYWSDSARGAILPLYLCFSFAWSLEMVTHLEELCFWLFLVNSDSAHQDWFRSAYFKTWAFGSCVAVLTLPLLTILTREDPYKCESYTFLTGSLGSLALTIWFIPVLRVFPSFIENLKLANVDVAILARLTKFHELNCIRVVFRFLFTVPFVIVGVDGARPHQHIDDNIASTHITDRFVHSDLLSMVAAVGWIVSSGITLVIFFPRDIESEMIQKEQVRERRQASLFDRRGSPSPNLSHSQNTHVQSHANASSSDVNYPQSYHQLHQYPRTSTYGLPSYEAANVNLDGLKPSMSLNKGGIDQFLEADSKHVLPAMALQPNRRMKDGEVELGTVIELSEGAMARHNLSPRGSNVNHLIHNWRSPIGKLTFHFALEGEVLMPLLDL
ncbi:hypothetical protein BU15DRAFT_51578 [Melanogaster broomeanus]|nr:hypothetical protein BU15DRAFT_51578 [Melanogaster broomeanus]